MFFGVWLSEPHCFAKCRGRTMGFWPPRLPEGFLAAVGCVFSRVLRTVIGWEGFLFIDIHALADKML
jgi:hypothetical protein